MQNQNGNLYPREKEERFYQPIKFETINTIGE
jgi:hypothetical protein